MAAKQLSVLVNELEARDEKILSFWESFIRFNAIASDVYVPPKTYPALFGTGWADLKICKFYSKSNLCNPLWKMAEEAEAKERRLEKKEQILRR